MDHGIIRGFTGVDKDLMEATMITIPEVAVRQVIISLMLQRMELFHSMRRTAVIKAL